MLHAASRSGSCAMAGPRPLLAVLASIFLEGTADARLLTRPTAAGNAIVEVVFALERRATDLDAVANNICLKALDPKFSLPLEFVH